MSNSEKEKSIYDKGYAAAMEGYNSHKNPYSIDTEQDQHFEWLDGWIDGRTSPDSPENKAKAKHIKPKDS